MNLSLTSPWLLHKSLKRQNTNIGIWESCSFPREIDFQTKETFQILWVRKKCCLLQCVLNISIFLKISSSSPRKSSILQSLSAAEAKEIKEVCLCSDPAARSAVLLTHFQQARLLKFHRKSIWDCMGFRNGEKGEEEMRRRAMSREKAEIRVQVRFCAFCLPTQTCNYLGNTWANRHGEKKIKKRTGAAFQSVCVAEAVPFCSPPEQTSLRNVCTFVTLHI